MVDSGLKRLVYVLKILHIEAETLVVKASEEHEVVPQNSKRHTDTRRVVKEPSNRVRRERLDLTVDCVCTFVVARSGLVQEVVQTPDVILQVLQERLGAMGDVLHVQHVKINNNISDQHAAHSPL